MVSYLNMVELVSGGTGAAGMFQNFQAYPLPILNNFAIHIEKNDNIDCDSKLIVFFLKTGGTSLERMFKNS